MINRVIRKIKALAGIKQSHIEYWRSRASNLGERSVVNMEYNIPVEEITNYQVEQIFPVLKKQLKGDEKLILDYGCGTGRFTQLLAKSINGKAIGVDVVKMLINIAKSKDRLNEYLVLKNSKLPFNNNSIDIVWVCLVLGGIPEKSIKNVIQEISRVLADEGLLIVTENTSNKSNNDYWAFRTPETYIDLLRFANMKIAGSYKEINEEITIFAGRKMKFIKS